MKKVLAAVTCAALASGCATLLAGGPDRVSVTSNVPGATVYLDNQPVGATPMIVVLDRDNSQGLIRIEAPGYNPVMMQRSKSINGWFWGNICLGGVVGMLIDAVTGDMHKFDGTPINVALTPSAPRPAAAPAVEAQPQGVASAD